MDGKVVDERKMLDVKVVDYRKMENKEHDGRGLVERRWLAMAYGNNHVVLDFELATKLCTANYANELRWQRPKQKFV